jgi:H+-transporting ATPase
MSTQSTVMPEPGTDLASLSVDELRQKLDVAPAGLKQEEAQKRLAQYGYNELVEEKVHPLRQFLSYFWGPIPWMIEIAAILSCIVQHWADFGVILALLVFNAMVGFWEEYQAGNAIAALKQKLALKARVKRNNNWTAIPARELVPGDLIRLRLGDIVPADAKLSEGDYLSVDQSALTGESLPAEKKPGDMAYSGSIVRQGEMEALVAATGSNTFFGRTARLVQKAGAVSHFQKALLGIGDYLIYLSLGLAAVLVLTQLFRGHNPLQVFQFVLILVVAAIPVAMPAVLSVTMAVGALALSRMKAIVSRLQSIEEIAGIDILCSDKTGTLTQNKLTLGEPVPFDKADVQGLILAGALASKEEDADAIDSAIINALKDRKTFETYTQVKFVPFDPVHKRTEAEIKGPEGKSFYVTKGAPQVILALCQPEAELANRVNAKVEEFAKEGYRTLGIARREDEKTWQFLGVAPLFDPPRTDSAETIQRAEEHGIEVKMVTGDNLAIAKQVSSQLKLGPNIHAADEFFRQNFKPESISASMAAQVEAADGFAQVFPEHKFDIVEVLQQRGHIVGMTGDGVNDAPALKQADVGIAVSGATDAARAAAALVLTAPGLSVIVQAVEEARKIFERMNSYAIYRITETIRIMFFVVLAMLVFNFYPITAIMIILLAFFNDLPIMAIAYDNTWLEPKPVHWQMRRVLSVSTVLGLIGVIETFGILLIAKLWMDMTDKQIQTFIFLKLAVAGHLTLFVARTKRPFLSKPYPAGIVLWSAIITKIIATLLVAYGFGFVTPISWPAIALVWGYCIVWIFIEDWAKLDVYRHLQSSGPRHRRLLDRLQKPLHPWRTA